MQVTYIRRKREELVRTVQRVRDIDLIRKADLISESSDPDHIFSNHAIVSRYPYGVLVLFDSLEDRRRTMPDLPRCDDLDRVEQLISTFQAYPPLSQYYFEEKRQAYIKDIRRFRHMNAHSNGVEKERARLEHAMKDATAEKENLEKENTDRINRIKMIETEIQMYEEALKKRRKQDANEEKLRKVVEESEPLRETILQDTTKLRELAKRIAELRIERAMTNRDVSPTTSHLQELEEKRLTGEHKSISSRLSGNTSRLKKLQEEIDSLTDDDFLETKAEDIENSLGLSRRKLEETKNALTGSSQLVNNIDLRVEILAARLEAIRLETQSQPQDIENAYIAALARAEELLNAWISSSVVFRKIMAVDGISGKELVEALFFASGPLCACGQDTCMYLDGAGVNLLALMMYGNGQEHMGFSNVIVFE